MATKAEMDRRGRRTMNIGEATASKYLRNPAPPAAKEPLTPQPAGKSTAGVTNAEPDNPPTEAPAEPRAKSSRK